MNRLECRALAGGVLLGLSVGLPAFANSEAGSIPEVSLPAPNSEELRVQGHVRQLSVDFIYIDVGSRDGLSIGDTLTVRSGSSIGERIVASYVAGRSSSCSLVSKPGTTAEIAVGDEVLAILLGTEVAGIPEDRVSRLSFPAPRNGTATVPRLGSTSRTRSGWGRVHGSLSMDYLRTVSEDGRAWTRDPRGRLEVRGRDLAGRDLRARVSVRTGYGPASILSFDDALPGVRQLWFEYHDNETRIGARGGRLLVADAGSFAYLDGGSFGYTPSSTFGLGLFAGRQPNWVDNRAKGSVHVVGSSIRARFEPVRGSLLVSLFREIRQADRDRNWTYLEGRAEPWSNLRFYARGQLQLTQRDDSERIDGKADPEFDPADLEIFRSYLESRLSASVRYRPRPHFWWSVSYDESSLVSEFEATRSAEDRFDRAGRNGWATTVNFEPSDRWRTQIGGSLRDGGRETRWSVNGVAERRKWFFGLLDATVLMRVFDTGYSRGSTPSIELAHRSSHGFSLELRSGLHFYRSSGLPESRSDRWVRASSSVNLPARLRIRFEAETSGGDNVNGSRFYGQLVRSF